MNAITTKFLGPRNFKGARIRATTASGKSLTIPYNYEGGHQVHATAALELARKLGWTGTLIEGGTKDGMVFVFETGSRYSI
jgi:hypothetical protein